MSYGTIQNNIIAHNSAAFGGGLSSARGLVSNNIISGNIATTGGGLQWCHGRIQHNTIVGNSASSGGGGIDSSATWYSYSGILNNIIWGNSAPSGAQINNSYSPEYSCIQNWTGGGTGNISLNPLFVDADNGNFYLLAASPCIDAGMDAGIYYDIEGNIRPFDLPGIDNNGPLPEFDMGAYEIIPEPSICAILFCFLMFLRKC